MKYYLPLIFLIFGLVLSSRAQAQIVTGKVADATSGDGLPGVTVLVQGTTTGTVTDMNGNYSLNVTPNATLVYSFIGYVSQTIPVNNRSVIDVQLSEDVEQLSEVVVTGYTTQRREDITGAVSIVKAEELLQTPSGNVQQQLQGRVAGVTTSGSGQPGAGAKVRIRGFGTFGNNDPLYVVDGVPTQNVGSINPNDVESMQVLKDASAASIYGSRAANGVIIITTKKGKSGTPRVSLDSYYGTQVAPDGPELLNTQQLGDLLWRQALNAGQTPSHAQYGSGTQPVIPDFILAGGESGVMEGNPAADPSLYNIDFTKPRHQIVRANKEGTDWWDEVFDPSPIQNHQLTVSGGTDASQYNVGFNYFNQDGIAKYTGYKRYSVRANTQFSIKNAFRVGENLTVSYTESNGTPGGEGGGENAILQIVRIQPIVPVYDIMGNFAGTAGGNLGNASNPVADLFRARNNQFNGTRLFGNIFAEVDILKGLTARTSFGLDFDNRYSQSFQPRTYERAENINTNRLNERNDFNRDWTWTNTLVYKRQFNEMHDITLLAGTEAIKGVGRGVGGSRLNFFSEDPNFWVLSAGSPTGQNNFSYQGINTLYSVFGRIDYTLANKYLFNATLRRDGSSRFGSESRYGTFPAFSIGWRLSEEGFMQGIDFIDDFKIRGGWGKMGNQLNANPNNAFSFFQSSPNNSFYDIGGTNTSTAIGFDQQQLGNPLTAWESAVTTNVGFDAVFFKSKLEIAFDWYIKDTEGLLRQAQAPGTLGNISLPTVNIGDVRNTGIDLGVTTRGNIGGGFRYDVGLTFGAYKNEVLRLGENEEEFFTGGGTRFGSVARTTKGQPISSFWGYEIEGFFDTEEELSEIDQFGGEWVGGWRLKDQNNDGVINADDQGFIGSPHPDFTAGLNLGLGYKNFDFNMFLYSVVGNEIYNYSKWWTDFNAFQGNRSVRLLNESWTPENTNATLPILRASDNFSNSISTDYYVESGSYLRARTVQLGYTLDQGMLNRLGMSTLRVYVQAQNLFTITGYSGIDPDVTIQGGELGMGVDVGWYPTPKQFLIGLTLGL